MPKKSNLGYELSEECQLIPRRYYLKDKRKWVGVGGEIPRENLPAIPEATIEEYLEIGKNSSLVMLTSTVTSAKVIDQAKS